MSRATGNVEGRLLVIVREGEALCSAIMGSVRIMLHADETIHTYPTALGGLAICVSTPGKPMSAARYDRLRAFADGMIAGWNQCLEHLDIEQANFAV